MPFFSISFEVNVIKHNPFLEALLLWNNSLKQNMKGLLFLVMMQKWDELNVFLTLK